MTFKVAIKMNDKYYLTAVNGGGIGDGGENLPPMALHTDATAIGPWEKFTLKTGWEGHPCIVTCNGYFLSAVNGGGMGSDGSSPMSVYTNATEIGAFEIFTVELVEDKYLAFKTSLGKYLTAVNGGGMGDGGIYNPAMPILTNGQPPYGPNEQFDLIDVSTGAKLTNLSIFGE
jgi:hypothetical protein